jgi:hypothetical protein
MKGQPETLWGWIDYRIRQWLTHWQAAELSTSTRYRQPGGKAGW